MYLGSVLAPMLLNIYMYDLPTMQSRKYGYADYRALLLSKQSYEAVEEGLSEDRNILSSYLRNWHLKLSIDKTITLMFHLSNKEVTRELNIMINSVRLQSQPTT